MENAAQNDEENTLVVAAKPDGFAKVFLGEKRWFSVRLRSDRKQTLKYVAAYLSAPVSAITHVATVKSIEPYGEDGQYVIYFAGEPSPIGPIGRKAGGKVSKVQTSRLTSFESLKAAQTLDDVWER